MDIPGSLRRINFRYDNMIRKRLIKNQPFAGHNFLHFKSGIVLGVQDISGLTSVCPKNVMGGIIMKRLFSLFLIICMLCTSFVVTVSAADGTGTESDPILISTPQELQAAAIEANSSADFTKGKYYKLTADLDFADYDYGDNAGFVPFGIGSAPFSGTFDGDGHTISNIKLSTETDSASAFAGLFAILVDGTVKNLGVINTKVDVRSKKEFGIMAGRVKGNSKFENCFIRNWEYLNIVDCNFGGFAGYIFWGQLTCKNCYVINNADASNWGVPGYRGEFFADAGKDTNSSFTAINCYTSGGEFAAESSNITGFTTTIVNCYKNSDGVYKYWNNNTAGKYLATALSADSLKAVSDRLMGVYVADSGNVNSGFPRLRWETESGAYTGSSEETPYLIRNYKDFENFRDYINKGSGCGENEYFKMTEDIDVGANLTSENKLMESFVGQLADVPFKGNFDGDGHVFKNFNFELWSGFAGNFGVFGNIDGNAVIKNTGIEDVKFRLKQKCSQDNGGLIGAVNGNATVENCYARNVTYEELNDTYGEDLVLGGLIGTVGSADATVKNCYAVKCNVAANVNRDAELIGWVKEQATITNCYSDKRLLKARNRDTEVDRSKFTACYAVEQSAKDRDDGRDWWDDNGSYFMPNTTTDGLKNLASALGSAFVDGRKINACYPQLSWEKPIVSFDGNGTEAEPYLIADADDLAELSYLTESSGKFFKMTNDIDMTGIEWKKRIGTEDAPFKGSFDGSNHLIKNLHIVGKTGDTVIGLFGCLGDGAIVKNVGIVSPVITTANCINGVLAAKACGNVSIEGCFIRHVTASAENHRLGLFVGYLSDATLSFKDCYVVSGIDYETKKAHGRYGDFVGSVDNESGVCKLVAENCYSSQFYFCLDFGKSESISFTSELKNVYINSDGSIHSWHDDIGANGEGNWLGERKTTDELKAIADKLGIAYADGSEDNDGYPQFAWELAKDSIVSAEINNNQVVVELQKWSKQPGTLFTAVYKEDVLVQLIMQEVTESGVYNIDADAASGDAVKVFLINAETGLMPLTSGVSAE